MKPFNPNPIQPRQQWVRGRSQRAFHLRDTRVAMPNVRVACGEPMRADDLPYEFELQPYQRCEKCVAAAEVAV